MVYLSAIVLRLPPMASRRSVLLTQPESARSPRLPFRQQAPRTCLESTLNTYKKHRGRRFHLLSIANPSLCFLTLTKCKFSNSFVLISIQNAGGVPSPSSPLSEKLGHILSHLVLPVRPVVSALGTPVVERMAYALAGKNFGEAVRGAAVFPWARAGGDVDITGGNLLVKPRIAHIREVIDRIVEIKIVVEHPVHEISQVVHAGHGETPLDHVGMLEERVSRMIRPERCAHRGDGDSLRLAVVPDEGNHLLAQIGVEHRLHVAAVKRVRALVIETFTIDGIRGKEFDSSCVNEIRERSDHALAFELQFIPRAGRKPQQWRAPVAVNSHAKLNAQPRRMPAVIFAFHPCPLASCGGRESMPAMSKPGNEFEPCRKAIARNKMKCAETRRGATNSWPHLQLQPPAGRTRNTFLIP